MQSTLPWIILTGFYFNVISPKTLIKKLSFDGCKNDSWRVADVSLMPRGDEINVVADIAYGNKPTNIIHQVKLTLTGCSENFKCTNHTDPVVSDLKCGANVTGLDKEACDIAETLAEWQLESGRLKGNQTNSTSEGACIHYDTELVNPAVIDTMNTNVTTETNDHGAF